MNHKWIPLIQTLIWVFLIAIGLFYFRNKLNSILSAMVERIVNGAPLGIGPITLGTPPPSIREAAGPASATTEGKRGAATEEKDVIEKLKKKKFPDGFSEEVYLVHQGQVLTPRTQMKTGLYRVRVWLESYENKTLDQITQVTYRLHDTFGERNIIATQSRDKDFELWLNVYGEFTIIAYVKKKDETVLWLARYLDLPGRPPD